MLTVTRNLVLLGVVAAGLALPFHARAEAKAVEPRDEALERPTHTRTWIVRYRAHTGRARDAYLLLPSWYGPRRNPPIALVISPHGRGTDGRANARLWGDLPALGGFAVVNPDGEGRTLGTYSWGAPGQIDDLARMPNALRRALPWLRIDRGRIYAFGGSMGGQETLLLVAKHPRLLAGAAAFDSLVDFAHQYYQYPRLACASACRSRLGTTLGSKLQGMARAEVGGDPASAARAYAARSPLAYAREIARACVPLQLWWSRRDRIVVDPDAQSARLLHELHRLNPRAPVESVEGKWVHSAEMRAKARLPFALARFDLMPRSFDGAWGVAGAHVTHAPGGSCAHTA